MNNISSNISKMAATKTRKTKKTKTTKATRKQKNRNKNYIASNNSISILFQNQDIIQPAKTIKVEKLVKLHDYPSPIIINLDGKKIARHDMDSVIKKIELAKLKMYSYEELLSDQDKLKLKRLAMNISHNLSTYINKVFFKYDGVRGVSNGYVKLWEIYQQFGAAIMKKVKSPATFLHMCEAPGNWIKCTKQYMTRFHPMIRYKWFANSLNPFNKEVAAKYGKVFQDELKYMATYPDQWVFGADDTGDITRVANIKNIAKRTGSVALITGDAGLGTDMDVFLLQKLEVAQLVMSLACVAKGGSAIIKYFASSYGADFDLMKRSVPYVASIIATYQKYYEQVHMIKPITSNPMSSEYYIVAIGFKGITSTELDKYYHILEDFKTDTPVGYSRRENPNLTKGRREASPFPVGNYKTDAAIENAIATIYQLNANQTEIVNVIMECHLEKDKNPPKECHHYLQDNTKYMIPLFKTWIKKNRYVAMNIK